MIFYGVFLKNQAISAILDVVRFLGEPNKIRFSHITMRGPYIAPLRKERLVEMRDAYRNVSSVRLTTPACFFNDKQSTVVVGVDLIDLRELFYKKNFPDGLPHITLYDGKSRSFAAALYDIASTYLWDSEVSVTDLMEIPKSRSTDQVFLEFYVNFQKYFSYFFEGRYQISDIKLLPEGLRLALIREIFDQCTEKPGNFTSQPIQIFATASR